MHLLISHCRDTADLIQTLQQQSNAVVDTHWELYSVSLVCIDQLITCAGKGFNEQLVDQLVQNLRSLEAADEAKTTYEKQMHDTEKALSDLFSKAVSKMTTFVEVSGHIS